MLTAILTGILVVVANFIAVFFAWRLFTRFLRAYLEPQHGQPSQLALLFEFLIDRFLEKLNHSMKSSLGGLNSVEARNEKRIDVDIVKDLAADTSPVLGALISAFPSLAKRVANNPSLIPLALKALEKWGGAATAARRSSSPGGNGRDYTGVY